MASLERENLGARELLYFLVARLKVRYKQLFWERHGVILQRC